MVALATYEPLFDKAMSNVVEVKARGAEVLALTTEHFREKMEKTADSRHRRALHPSECSSRLWVWCRCSCLPTMWRCSGAATSTSPGTWPSPSLWSEPGRGRPRIEIEKSAGTNIWSPRSSCFFEGSAGGYM